ncbi:unnamed protein product, partial [Didymodactylos carnosus]
QELKGNYGDSDYSSDSDQDPHDLEDIAGVPYIQAQSIRNKIDEINLLLQEGKQIDLLQYAPLYIVHYRGTHFFTQFFTQDKRRQVRNEIQHGI